MEETIQHGTGEGGIVVEDFGPVFKGQISGDDAGTPFVSPTQNLEEQIGTGPVDGIPVGDKTLKHSHPESLIVDLTDYNGRVTTGDGKISEVQAKAGSVSWRPALTHVVENIGSQPMEGLILEPKKPASKAPATK